MTAVRPPTSGEKEFLRMDMIAARERVLEALTVESEFLYISSDDEVPEKMLLRKECSKTVDQLWENYARATARCRRSFLVEGVGDQLNGKPG